MQGGLRKLGAILKRAVRVGVIDWQNLEEMRPLAKEMSGLEEWFHVEKPCSWYQPSVSQNSGRLVSEEGGSRRLGLRGSRAVI